jgi:hypothetical protein
MSALAPKADIGCACWYVRFVPKADITGMVKMEGLGPLATSSAARSDARAGVAPGNRLNDQDRRGRDTDGY